MSMRAPMTATRSRAAALLLASLGWSGVAHATTAAVPPLVSNGVDPLIVLNMTSLISSEMDFMSDFDGVQQLEKMPAGMSAKCLGSTSCLGGVAKGAGTDAVVAGAVSAKGNKFDLYLVYFKDGGIVRSKEYTLANVPSVIADSMSGYVKELVTGQAPAAQAAVAAGTIDGDVFEDSDEDDFGMVAIPTGGSSRRIATPGSGGGSGDELDGFDFDSDPEDERRKAAAARADEQRRADEAQRQREEDERRKAAAVAAQREREADQRRQAEEEEERRKAAAVAAARRPAEPEAEEEEELSFGDADITFAPVSLDLGDEDEYEQEKEDRGGVAMLGLDDNSSSGRDRAPREKPERVERAPRDKPERAPREKPDRESSRDLDEDRSRSVSRDRGSDEGPTAIAAGRLGYANFQGLGFVTYGAEVSFLATEKLAIIGGVEAYSTRRAVPQELQEQGAPPEVWNTILPFNAGLVYRFLTGSVQPYAGGDVVMIPGYVKDAGGLATGLRIRAGADFMVTDGFGFNLNTSLGMWAGQNFDQVATAASNAAFTPQFSAGTVVHF